jgi:hypothetical protein
VTGQNGVVRNDLISQFLNWTQRTEGRDMTDKELRDVIVSFVVAGRDTTGTCVRCVPACPPALSSELSHALVVLLSRGAELVLL